MTDHLGAISELRMAENQLYPIVQAYNKIKAVRENLERLDALKKSS